MEEQIQVSKKEQLEELSRHYSSIANELHTVGVKSISVTYYDKTVTFHNIDALQFDLVISELKKVISDKANDLTTQANLTV